MATPVERYHFRKERVRKKVFGTSDRPRLSIYRSLKYIYAQIVDDSTGKTLAYVYSLGLNGKGGKKSSANIESAKQVGKMIAEKSLKLNIKKVVFDRGGRIFHGTIKALADSARENGLEF